jgi:hypothetical protein
LEFNCHASRITEPEKVSLPDTAQGAVPIGEGILVIEEHPKFIDWLAAFEHLVKAHDRIKSAGAAANLSDLRKELFAAKAAYLKLADELD